MSQPINYFALEDVHDSVQRNKEDSRLYMPLNSIWEPPSVESLLLHLTQIANDHTIELHSDDLGTFFALCMFPGLLSEVPGYRRSSCTVRAALAHAAARYLVRFPSVPASAVAPSALQRLSLPPPITLTVEGVLNLLEAALRDPEATHGPLVAAGLLECGMSRETDGAPVFGDVVLNMLRKCRGSNAPHLIEGAERILQWCGRERAAGLVDALLDVTKAQDKATVIGLLLTTPALCEAARDRVAQTVGYRSGEPVPEWLARVTGTVIDASPVKVKWPMVVLLAVLKADGVDLGGVLDRVGGGVRLYLTLGD